MRHRTVQLICLCVTFLSAGPVAAAAQFAGGTGEPNDPYQIATAEQLISIGADPNLWSKHYVLVSDIDLDPNLPGGRVFTQAIIAPHFPQQFSGSIDGQNHVIQNLVINAPDGIDVGGLVGEMYTWGTLKNLGLENVAITGGWGVGGLVASNMGTITHCYSTGVVTGQWGVGGIVGYSNWGVISSSYSTAVVTGTYYVGGLAGRNRDASISFCYSTGSVAGDEGVGGLTGGNHGWLVCCYSVGSVSGDEYVGGLAGYSSEAGTEENCFFLAPADGGGPDNGVGTPLTTDQMKQQASFTGWDFWGNSADGSADLWFIPTDAYPVFPWQTDITGLRTVPIVAGFDRQDAIVVLEDAGFGVREHEECYRTIAARQVVRTDPCSASWAPLGSTVDLFVSAGPYDWSTNPGDGTQETPYQVGTAGQLESLVDHPELWDKHFVLTADIDMDPNLRVVWPGPGKGLDCPIAESFSGTWDGAGHRITNLTMNFIIKSPSAKAYRGFFDQISPTGIVQALTIERASVSAELQGGVKRGHQIYVGTLAGWNDGTIVDCHIAATVKGPTYSPSVGGMVGSNTGQISRCVVLGSVNGKDGPYAGGVAGENSGTITDCQASVSVFGDGGLCGGLVGVNSGARIPIGSDPHVRTLTVQNSDTGAIINCCATGNVSGPGTSLGGLVGDCYGGSISHSYATGAVLGGNDAGGLVGHASQAEIVDCYATGPVVGDNYGSSGGLVGEDDLSIITHSYSTGQVSSLSNTYHPVGGLIGQGSYDADVVACFWDIETSGQTSSAGGTGLTTAEMMDVNTYLLAGWDFIDETTNGTEDTWIMPTDPTGYPRLAWESDSPD